MNSFASGLVSNGGNDIQIIDNNQSERESESSVKIKSYRGAKKEMNQQTKNQS